MRRFTDESETFPVQMALFSVFVDRLAEEYRANSKRDAKSLIGDALRSVAGAFHTPDELVEDVLRTDYLPRLHPAAERELESLSNHFHIILMRSPLDEAIQISCDIPHDVFDIPPLTQAPKAVEEVFSLAQTKFPNLLRNQMLVVSTNSFTLLEPALLQGFPTALFARDEPRHDRLLWASATVPVTFCTRSLSDKFIQIIRGKSSYERIVESPPRSRVHSFEITGRLLGSGAYGMSKSRFCARKLSHPFFRTSLGSLAHADLPSCCGEV